MRSDPSKKLNNITRPKENNRPPGMLHDAFLGIGSNIGDRRTNLNRATIEISRHMGSIHKVSRIYETEAWGYENQPAFLNQVLQIKTPCTPGELLAHIQNIELAMGRKKETHWGARNIDIDILFYDHLMMQTEHLTIPHPRLHERNFVLIPLAEIAPGFSHPKFGLRIDQLAALAQDGKEVTILEGDAQP